MISSSFRATGVAVATMVLGSFGTVAAQQSPLERLSVHGFLTQAFGISDDHQYLGIPTRGTADYRTVAVQLRYEFSDRDAFVIQAAHERFGRSRLNEVRPDIYLDWVFYQRRMGDNTTVRVGKILLPIGIYSEIRDVGTLLPFYRPPTSMYGEAIYSSETLNGVSVGQRVPLGQEWLLNVDAFVGDWEYLQADFETFGKVDGGMGVNMWLETPLQGLRVGGAVTRFSARNILGAPAEQRDELLWSQGSVDGQFERFTVRAEASQVTFRDATTDVYSGSLRAAYAQVGVSLTSRLSFTAQADILRISFDVPEPQPPFPPQPLELDWTQQRDLGLAARYLLSPNVVLKLEGHRARGYSIDDQLLFPLVDAPAQFNYAVFSVSTSF
jgi:hypothetical protein